VVTSCNQYLCLCTFLRESAGNHSPAGILASHYAWRDSKKVVQCLKAETQLVTDTHNWSLPRCLFTDLWMRWGLCEGRRRWRGLCEGRWRWRGLCEGRWGGGLCEMRRRWGLCDRW
jgi:hypothetical protein